MKCFVFSVLAVISSIAFCNAQSYSFGIKTGGTLSYFNGKLEHALYPKLRWHAGVFGECFLTPKLACQAEVFYNKQGAVEPRSALDYKFNYLQIPLMVKYYLFKNLSVECGPQLGISITGDNYRHDAEILLPLNTPIVSAGLGSTYYLDNKFFIQSRFNYSFTTVDAMAGFYNSFVMLSIGYQLKKIKAKDVIITPRF